MNSLCEAAIDVIFNLGENGGGVNRDGWTLIVRDACESGHCEVVLYMFISSINQTSQVEEG